MSYFCSEIRNAKTNADVYKKQSIKSFLSRQISLTNTTNIRYTPLKWLRI